MKIISGVVTPVLMIHGGAGNVPKGARRFQIHESIERILKKVYPILLKGGRAETAVVMACKLLEDDPLFNAGKGSQFQSDGKIRMSAALMNGNNHCFSGVINVQKIKNPIEIAKRLASKKDRVLSEQGAKAFALSQGLEEANLSTPKTKEDFLKKKKGKTGTVGALAFDRRGGLVAGTSTGGKGFEMMGRVSDTATVAGNYANRFAAVSATGIGESIVDHAIAAAVAVRVEDGMTLKKAVSKTLQSPRLMKAQIGLIGITREGEWIAETLTSFLSWGYIKGAKVEMFQA